MIQLLPTADDGIIDRVEKSIEGILPVTKMLDSGMNIEEIIKTALKDFTVEVLDEGEAEYKCNCSRERVERALISTGREELESMANELPEIEVNCHFCDKKYVFTPAEIRNLID